MLLRALLITDPDGPHHGQRRDLRIADGKIVEIAESIRPREDEEILELTDARVSAGFVDIGAYLGEPGHEERGDVASLTASAIAGGYVAVAVLPNTDPVRQSAADMAFLNNHRGAVDLLPIAALSRDTAGKDLTDLLELDHLGAVAFGDGPRRPAPTSLLKRGLEYAKATRRPIISTPFSKELADEGQIHEGAVSTRLGLRGIPSISETVPLLRDLELAAYTGGKLLVHLLSSAEGVSMFRRAVNAGAGTSEQAVGLAATVSAHHLQFTVEELAGFDPNFKVLPPLREERDRLALVRAVADGTIGAIVSHHQPRHGEEKDLEFSYATFGARGLETAFRQCLGLVSEELLLDRIVSCFTSGPRRLLGLPVTNIEVGQPAGLTIFTTSGSSTIGLADLRGKTDNSPLLGRELPGRIYGTVSGGTYNPA